MSSQASGTQKEKGNGNGNGNGSQKGADVRERVLEVRERADDLARTVGSIAKDLRGVVTKEVKSRPYRAMTVAALAGFVLGGGLSVTVVRSAARIGLRFAMAAMLNQAIKGSST